jgi:Ca2+-binding RTX toxin-like protein
MAVIIGGAGNNTRLIDQPSQSNTIFGDTDGSGAGVGGNDRVFALDGNDVVIGDALRITPTGRGGNDLLYGGTGIDTLYGDARLTLRGVGGDDVLFAGPGGSTRQVLYGDAFALGSGARGGNDRLEGGDEMSGDGGSLTGAIGGQDIVDARDVTVGSDIRLYGDALGVMDQGSRGGSDILWASSLGSRMVGDGLSLRDTSVGGNDQLNGGSGRDVLFGDGGADLRGSAVGGNDVLRGRAGNDELFGDAPELRGSSRGGNDQLYSGGGNDRIWGDGRLFDSAQGGKDSLHFSGSFGDDVVLDFRHGEDRLIFNDLIAGDLDIDRVNGNTVISSITGDSVTILGYTGTLSYGSDIIFD